MRARDIPPLKITPEELALAAAAKTWDDVRRQVVALETKRNEIRCLRERTPEIPPCWKTHGWFELEPEDETAWCRPCIDRQKLYDEIRNLRVIRGARLRALYAAAARWKP